MTTGNSETAVPTTKAVPTRIGCVAYLNTLPLIEGLGKLEDVRLTLTAPSKLIDLLIDDEVDMALVSLIDAQRAPEPLAMIPVGMIGCDGPTLTVRLFSSVPVEQVRTVHTDADSHTSVALLSILLKHLTGHVPKMVEFDADAHRAHVQQSESEGRDPEWPEALLLIGDKVVTDSPPAILYPHQLDLGEAWKEMTGLPFVYATWMCLERRAAEPAIATAAAVLDRQRRHNAGRLDWIVNHRAPVRGWPIRLAREYVRTLLRYDVTDAHRQAADRFFDEAAAIGAIEERRPTRWVEPV
jgi:chorismate dehydratase